ncbi:MAG: sensor histidine kinase [Sphingobacteriaceae bacterium]
MLLRSKNILPIWKKLIGNKSDTTLEQRIFHVVCVISIFSLAINVLFNILLGIFQLSAIFSFLMMALTLAYYLSRFKKKSIAGILIFEILNNLLLLANFYYNSGINGPSILIFLVSFFLTIAIVPKKQYRIWIPLNVLLVFSLLWIQYRFPDWILNTYSSEDMRYFDAGFTYLFSVALILVVIRYLLNAYQSEKNAVSKKASDLENSNETKDKLLSIIAHDLKDPLFSIQGYLELLLEYNLDEKEKVIMEKELLDRTKNTTEMLSNLLVWAKSQMEGTKIDLISFYPNQALLNTLRISSIAAETKGITLHSQLDPDICLFGDKDMLQLVVRNLLMNAIKFTNVGGQINISSYRENDRNIITISDNGLGIPEEEQANVFSLKARSTFGTGKEKGIGLGLVLCKEFTELQGGKIWFESSVGKGTSFYISLPRCQINDYQRPVNIKPELLYFT